MQLASGLAGAIVLVLPFAVAVTSFEAAPTRTSRGVEATRRAAAVAVERSLPLLQSSADTWFEKRTCSSCHHQGLGLLAVSAAREQGFAIDTARLRNQVSRTSRMVPSWVERYVTGDPSINESIGQSYRLVGLGASGVAPSEFTDAFVTMLAGKQHMSGFWPSYSRRPPHEDSEFTATAVTIRALRLFGRAPDETSVASHIARGKGWLRGARPVDHEDRVMQVLGLGWAGSTPAELAPFANALLATQHPDGGWSQIPTRPSDAYATGAAIVALNQAARIPMRDPRLQRAVTYLTSTQEPDGSWHVATRRARAEGLPYFETGYPHGEDQFISFAGAAWATVALALSQRERQLDVLMGRPAPKMVVPADMSAVSDVTPLMWAVWNGSAAEVKRLLDAGASARDTTRSGLTPLMFATGDVAKVRLLMEAGADVNARTKSGYSPLLLASAYDGGRESALLMLERGAVPDVKGRTGSFWRTTPLSIAIVRGDTALAQALVTRGANVHGAADTPETPMLAATWYGDASAMRWLLARGAAVDDGERFASGDTPTMLAIAAEDGRPDVVRVMLAAGASVDGLATGPYTALQLAVSTSDRGDAEIVTQLLSAGASLSLAAKDGETALTLARKWAPPHIVYLIEAAARDGVRRRP